MIESTFCFLSGVGDATEQKWWKLGLSYWNQFLDVPKVPGIGKDRKAFWDKPHIDLYTVAHMVGLRGGLKAIETAIGIPRREDLHGMNGSDAVRWWNRWRHGRDTNALERLIAYNAADCVNIQPFADWLYCRLAEQHQPSVL
jgi:uncharacterized protein YprB with RNaseH-like and TPR domain